MYIICVYDVKEKRCQKFMKLLRKYLFHVQNSVFEGTLTPKQYHSLRQEIDTLLNSDEDSVIFYVSYNDKQIYKNELGLKRKSRNIIIS